MAFILPIEEPWTSQPQGAVTVASSYKDSLKLTEVVLPNCGALSKTLIMGYTPSVLGGTVLNGVGVGGRSIYFGTNQLNCAIGIAADADNVFTSTSTASIFILRQSLTTSIYAAWTESWGYNAGVSDRVIAHMPGTDGYVYFDFGSTGTSNRISTPSTVTKSTNVESWCFVAGPNKGREIWRNGIKLAGDASKTGTRPTTSQSLRLGSMPTDYCDQEHIYLFMVGVKEWSDSQIQSISANPWQIFAP